MKREASALLIGGLITLALFIYGVHTKKKFWYWMGLIFIASPTGTYIGFALGKDPEEATPPNYNNSSGDLGG